MVKMYLKINIYSQKRLVVKRAEDLNPHTIIQFNIQ